MDRQQQVEAAARITAGTLFTGADPGLLLAMLGKLLLREDRDFHTIQTVEAAFRLEPRCPPQFRNLHNYRGSTMTPAH